MIKMLEEFELKMKLAMDTIVKQHAARFFEENPNIKRGSKVNLSFAEVNKLITQLDSDSSVLMREVITDVGITDYTDNVVSIILKAHYNSQKSLLEKINVQ